MTSPPTLSASLLATLDRPAEAADAEAAALHLLDWVGCALAGTATDLGRAMAAAQGVEGPPLAVEDMTLGEAAWRLGSFGSILEMDDVHRTAILHPGPVVMPAVLATATPETAGRAPLAVLRGYEAMIRLGRAVGPGHYAQFHNTATCGGLGAAVAAAWMLGLDTQRTQWAMGHALSVSGGLWECRNESAGSKHLHVAEAARRGVMAALAARAGVTGPLRILEGAQGFFAGLAPEGRPEALLEGEIWALHETSFKPWPACRHAHPAIDAALALRGELRGRAPTAIRIESYGDAVLFCDRPSPRDGAAARFSLQHAVAVALADGPPDLAAFEPPALDRPTYADLRALATVAEDPDFTARYPAHFGARVSVETAEGVLTRAVSDALGDPENPMNAAMVTEKFHALAQWAGVAPDLGARLEAAALALADPAHPGALTLRDALAEAIPAPRQPQMEEAR